MTRDAYLQIRLAKRQKAEIAQRAQERGQTMTDYILACVLGDASSIDARYALARQVVATLEGDPRAHARAVKRLRAFLAAGGLDIDTMADGAGDILAQACVLATMDG